MLTRGDLQAGVEQAERLIGYKLIVAAGLSAQPAETTSPASSGGKPIE